MAPNFSSPKEINNPGSFAADSPWPTFRRDHHNSGRSQIRGEYRGDKPWAFQTGKGVFSTPVIDGYGTIYVGSGDHYFYALDPNGSLKWKYKTGEIIDSAAALGAVDPEGGMPTITFVSGDGCMYNLRLDEIENHQDRLVWKFEAEALPEISFNRWFEGNVAIGPEGTLYAGNTNFMYYAVNPDGTLKWTYPTGSNCWSQAAFGADGTIYWGSLDTFVRAVSPDGAELWRRRTLGFIAASAAIGSDGTIYIGSFDSNLYALEPHKGRVKWKHPTLDHIYSSAAIGADEAGETTAIYFGSADGRLYALSPEGRLLWKYDAGSPIRSSPTVGFSPEGEEIIYFGCGDGRLYALNGFDGSLRWAYDTTPDDAELRDRNDLNGSPALGVNGIYIGGEHGFVSYVPYDYPLHAPNDPRCLIHLEVPGDFMGLYYVSPGGNVSPEFPDSLTSAAQIALELVARKDGETLPVHVYNNPIGRPKDALQITTNPEFPFEFDHSGDGKYIYIRLQSFLNPNMTYTIDVRGRSFTGGLRIGNLNLGGKFMGRFESTFHFRIAEPALNEFPLRVTDKETSALIFTRFAVPLPPMLPSLNQLGFDYIHWIAGTVAVTAAEGNGEGSCLLWAIGGKLDETGTLVVDPDSDFTLPLWGNYCGPDFMLSNEQFMIAITGIPIPFSRLELRGRLGQDLVVQPGAMVYADARVLSIPKFGPYLVIAGLANNWWEKLLVAGTYVTRPYPVNESANKPPQAITLHSLEYRPPSLDYNGIVEAFFDVDPGEIYLLENHRAGILLYEPQTLEIVPLDYHAALTARADTSGNLRSVMLEIPRKTRLPEKMRACVLLDVFPIHFQDL
jgi:outer membrane protein assembly factor BamB